LLCDAEDLTLSRQLVHRWLLGCQLYPPAALQPQKYLLVLITVRGSVNPRAMVRLEELGKLKNCKDLVWIRTRELPVCSVEPQPTTLHIRFNNVKHFMADFYLNI
jgi:hypothetical protein